MDAAWPALDRQDVGGWTLRAAAGVTQRANSIWPRTTSGDPALQLAQLREARAWYRSRRLPVIFQVFEGQHAAGLNDLLDAEGFTRQAETLVMTRGPLAGTAENPAVEISREPTADWLRVWWDVDGRGGPDALATARDILAGCPAMYALVRGGDGLPAAVGRLAVPAGGTHGGLYCMATLPGERRRGYGTAILRALLNAGAEQGLSGYWLLVTAANHPAQDLYAKAGFTEAGRYLYRQERPRRALIGC
ncbi:GNAT family N-acetyltransferase [Arthrobacter sp. C152]